MSATASRFSWLTVAICAVGMAGAAWLFWWAGPSLLALAHGNRLQRTFYIPSQSMRPTLEVDDRIMPLRVAAAGLQRGDVVVFKTQGEVRTSRIAARGGDTIELRDGVVVINGHSVPQRFLGAGPTLDGATSRLLEERFPGERGSHHILDLGAAPYDTVAPVRVDAGKLFLLSDNRDRAADSRVPLLEQGIEQVRASDVIGTVDSVYWSHDRSKIGRPIDGVRND